MALPTTATIPCPRRPGPSGAEATPEVSARTRGLLYQAATATAANGIACRKPCVYGQELSPGNGSLVSSAKIDVSLSPKQLARAGSARFLNRRGGGVRLAADCHLAVKCFVAGCFDNMPRRGRAKADGNSQLQLRGTF